MVETGEVQGNVLYAYGARFRYARYILLAITDPAAARVTLRRWFGIVTFGRRPTEKTKEGGTPGQADPPKPHVNVAFTFAGLETLGVPVDLLDHFPREFREGAQARAADNGDTVTSAPDKWMPGLGAGHVLVTIHAAHKIESKHVKDLLGAVDGMEIVHQLPAGLLDPPDGAAAPHPGLTAGGCASPLHREHFGFADGCSQPAVEGVDSDPTGDGVYRGLRPGWWKPLRWLELLVEDLGLKPLRRRWRPIRTGEFLLGYENEDGVLPQGPPAPLGPNGTFMVYRPMQQHVGALWRYIARQAKAHEIPMPVLRAKIVGRWDDGTPLALRPERPDPAVSSNRRRANDFLYREDRDGYSADPAGYACPLGAHIRRTNPRDGLPGGGERVMRHRIIRRGMPFTSRANGGSGLCFVCYSASIADGFEFIQRTWCDRGDGIGLGRERDLLLQQGEKQDLTGMVIPDADRGPLVLAAPDQPLVTVRGCEYLFVPSRSACAWLATLS